MMCFVQHEKLDPLNYCHLSKCWMLAAPLQLIGLQRKNTRNHHSSGSDQLMNDLMRRFCAIIKKKWIRFCGVTLKRRIIIFYNPFYSIHKCTLVGGKVNDVFKNGPFAGNDLPSDLLIIQTFNQVQQGFMLVLESRAYRRL